MAGARRASVLALASPALLVSGSAAAEASVTHNIALQVRDEQGRLVGSFSGTLRFDGPRAFVAHVCLKDELQDGRGPYFHFEYVHTDGSHLVGRTFRNSDGAPSDTTDRSIGRRTSTACGSKRRSTSSESGARVLRQPVRERAAAARRQRW
jgi:hypothetical protein